MIDDESKVLPFRPRAAAKAGDSEELYFSFSATLRIFGTGLDLDAITARLGLQPTHVHRAGEQRTSRAKPYEHDMWYVDAPLPEAAPLEQHIEWLYQAVAPHIAWLKELKSSATVDVFCGYRSNSTTAGFEVDHRALRLFQELEVPFGVSVIVFEDGD